MILDLMKILSRQYIQYAFIVGVTMSLSCALLGVSLVLKKHSMIGDGLSHVGFGAVAIAVCCGFTPLAFAIPVVIASSFLILWLSGKSKAFGDSAIAIFATMSLAIGYAAIEMGEGVNFSLNSYLYGSILGVSKGEVILSIIIAIIVILVFVLLYNKIFSVTFDETFSKSSGIKTDLINVVISTLISITVVIGMKVMGALLITALIIFPTLTARQVSKTFKGVTIFAAVESVVAFTIGLLVACTVDKLPIGSAIIFSNFTICIICVIVGKILKLKKN